MKGFKPMNNLFLTEKGEKVNYINKIIEKLIVPLEDILLKNKWKQHKNIYYNIFTIIKIDILLQKLMKKTLKRKYSQIILNIIFP